jgi:hypothetical protein
MQISIEHTTRQGRAFTTPAIWSEQHRLRTKAGVTQEFEWPVTRVPFKFP